MGYRCLGGVVALALAGLFAVPATATPPGHNGLIIWQGESRNAPPHLWVANPDGSAARSVFAARRRGDLEGTGSPTDPTVVFFSRGTRKPFSEDIFRGNLITGAVTRVTRPRSADIAPTISPDGTKLAYFAVPRPRRLNPNVPPPPQRLHIANIDGSGDHAITAKKRRSFDPDWSPDGQRLVYTEVRFRGRKPPQNRLVIINADGTGRQVLTAFGGPNEINPKWTPDGTTILYERLKQRGTRSDILAMSPQGGPSRVILATPAWETNPVPSPDGTRIVFTSDRDRRGRERLGPGFEVYTMALDGSAIVRLTNNRRADLFPDWQRLP
jgi:Tol biopolymer transport system component